MITLYSTLYITLSVILLMYGLYNKNSRLNLFGYSLALNIFPLVAIPALAMGDARVAGVPIAYIPMIASGLVLFISYGIIMCLRKLLLNILLFFIIKGVP